MREYTLFGFEQKDLESYVNGTILVPRYLKMARETPDFYPSIDNFKSSLYVASWKACLAHYRRIKAKKRADSFREGAMVQILQEDRNGELPMFETEVLHKAGLSADTVIRIMADDLFRRGYDLAARLFLCCALRGYRRKDIERMFPFVTEESLSRSFRHIHSVLLPA